MGGNGHASGVLRVRQHMLIKAANGATNSLLSSKRAGR